MIDYRREKDRTPPPELPADTPLRCNNCKRHRVQKTGDFYLCSRLTEDPDSGIGGCGRMFVANVYEAPA